MNKPEDLESTPKIEADLSTLFHRPQPDPEFVNELEKELLAMAEAETKIYSRRAGQVRRLSSAARTLAWVTAAALFVLALVWTLDNLIPSSVPGSRSTSSLPPADTPQAGILPGTPEATPIPEAPAGLGKVAYLQNGALWVKDIPQGQPQLLFQGTEKITRPLWSPSGEWLAFLQGDRLWLVNKDGGNTHSLGDASVSFYAWHPQKDILLFEMEGHLLLQAPEGNGPTQLVPGPHDPRPDVTLSGQPTWSPDGEQVAFAVEDAGHSYAGIWTMTPVQDAVPAERYVPPLPPQDGLILAGWLPNGRGLLYWSLPAFSASIAADGAPLWYLPLDGDNPGQPVELGNTLPYADAWSASQSGADLALMEGNRREAWQSKQIGLIEMETLRHTTAPVPSQAAISPTFSPDGSRVAYSAGPDLGDQGRMGDPLLLQRHLWLTRVDGSRAQQITGAPDYIDERPQWSRDGRTLLFARRDGKGRASLWSLALADSGDQPQTPSVLVDQVDVAPEYYGHIDWGNSYDWWQPLAQEQTKTLPTETPQATEMVFSGLTVEAYPLGKKDEQLVDPGLMDQQVNPAPEAVLAKRRAWRETSYQQVEQKVSAALAPFGYRLEKSVLYQGDESILTDVQPLGDISIDQAGDDFLLVLENVIGTKYFLIRKAGVEPWDPAPHLSIPPVFVGDEVLSVSPNGQFWGFQIERNGEVIYSAQVRASPVGPVRGLWAWGGHWALEAVGSNEANDQSMDLLSTPISGSILLDGQPLNETRGYQESFGFHLLAGRPFYFFKRDGKIGLSYAGEEIPAVFDQVEHYVCCSAGYLDFKGNDLMVWFFARRDGVWYYVEIGDYPSESTQPIGSVADLGLQAGRIALMAPDGSISQIYVANADGSNLRRISDGQSYSVWPSLSPDGSRVVYASQEGEDRLIRMADVETGQNTLFIQGPGYYNHPLWSPDGQKIAFELVVNGKNDIYLVNADGSGLHALVQTPVNETLGSWTPDSQEILFIADERPLGNTSNPLAIEQVNVATGEIREVTRFDSDQKGISLALSPDGSQIAYEGQAGDFTAIFLMDADGTHISQLTDGSSSKVLPVWSPDGKWLAYAEIGAGGFTPALISVTDRQVYPFEGLNGQITSWVANQ